MRGPYDDIIHLPHPTSAKHPRMPAAQRAAQFSPFAALTGYDAAVRETARLTDRKAELSEEAKAALDQKLRLAVEGRAEVRITYFKPDEKKAGGAHMTITGAVRKIDDFEQMITMRDGTRIPMGDVLSLEGDLFSALE